MVSTVPSSDQVQSPVVPLVGVSAKEFTAISGTLVIIIKIDNNTEMIFLVFFIKSSPKSNLIYVIFPYSEILYSNYSITIYVLSTGQHTQKI